MNFTEMRTSATKGGGVCSLWILTGTATWCCFQRPASTHMWACCLSPFWHEDEDKSIRHYRDSHHWRQINTTPQPQYSLDICQRAWRPLENNCLGLYTSSGGRHAEFLSLILDIYWREFWLLHLSDWFVTRGKRIWHDSQIYQKHINKDPCKSTPIKAASNDPL